MKLFVIGDSISQGFMSFAAARTDLSYSSIIARAMGLTNWSIPNWPKGGLPLNVELLLRRLEEIAGHDVNILEWPLVINCVRSMMDEVEDYYEGRKKEKPSESDPSGIKYFNNIAARGFKVSDAWLVDGKLCCDQIREDVQKGGSDDNFFGWPSTSFYRTALDVLNPSRDEDLNARTALGWLKHHNTEEAEGVENLILWLGANNALGTVVDLDIIATNDPTRNYSSDLSQPQRRKFNLWSPDHFEKDYRKLLDEVDDIMAERQNVDWRVFLATVPSVTLAPLAKGVGNTICRTDPFDVIKGGAKYYEYYTYFLFDEEYARTSETKLTREQVYTVDRYIACYNRTIYDLVDEKNKKYKIQRYHVVDINSAFLQAAYKRNNEEPTYEFPEEMSNRFPMVDTRYYHANTKGSVIQGGLVSLDGVHPSAIGQGLLAHEFLKVINKERGSELIINWNDIYGSDDLYMKPLKIMRCVRSQDGLAKLLLKLTSHLNC